MKASPHWTCADCVYLKPLTITVPPSKPYCLRYPGPVVRMPDDTACGEFGAREELPLFTKPARKPEPGKMMKPAAIKKETKPDAP